MNDERRFRKFATSLRCWFGVSLDDVNQVLPTPKIQDQWVGVVAIFVAECLRPLVATGEISNIAIDQLDSSLEPLVESYFKTMTGCDLVPYQKFVVSIFHREALAAEMLCDEDRQLFYLLVQNRGDVSEEQITEVYKCTSDKAQEQFDKAWARIQDTIAGDSVLWDWLFGKPHQD